MNRLTSRSVSAAKTSLCLGTLLLAFEPHANAGAISLGAWRQFGFTDAGIAATGCAPADPAGIFCTPSSGTPTTFLDAPAWTFTAPAGGVFITLVDAFTTLEAFELFDGGVSLGGTSAPNPLGDCGDDPAVCILDPNASRGTFFVAAGARSLTIVPTLSPDHLGSGFFIAQSDVPEPSTWALTGLGLVAFAVRRRKEGV